MTLTRANILAILFFIVLLSAVVPLYAQDALRAFTANLSITKEGASQTGKIYSDGGHAVRMELSSPGSAQDQIIILYLDTDTKQRLNARGRECIEVPYGSPGDEDFIRYLPGAKLQSRLQGTETINGYLCEKYLVKVSYKDRGYQNLEWRAKDLNGFVLRRQAVDGTWITEFNNVRFEIPAPTLFQIPPDLQKTIYSRDWAPVLQQLSFSGMSSKDSVEAARKAGLQVDVDEKPWGDVYIVYSDPVTNAEVMREHIIVDRFPSTKSTLPAPMLLSPENESVLSQYPRKTELKWKAVPGAVSYVVQVDIRGLTENGTWYWASEKGMSYKQETTSNTVFTFEFSGAQPGRWRVWAVGTDGSEGMKSDWWNFRYSK